MSKKILLMFMLFFVGIIRVNAEDIYYSNENGVSFTKKQYDFFSKMYYEGFQDYMTYDDFYYFDINNMNPDMVENSLIIENNILDSGITPMSEEVTGTKKTLKISKISYGNESDIVVTANWFKNPTIKSYDVIGARLSNVKLTNTPLTVMINDNARTNYTDIDTKTNGFGQSFLLSGTSISITQTYRVSNNGRVYASYQHATSAISKSNSKKYSISSTGYGGVFKFTGSAVDTYDNAQGVWISV